MKFVATFILFLTLFAIRNAETVEAVAVDTDVHVMPGKETNLGPTTGYVSVTGHQSAPKLNCPAARFRRANGCVCHMIKMGVMIYAPRLSNNTPRIDFPNGAQRRKIANGCAEMSGQTFKTTRVLCQSFIRRGKLNCQATAGALKRIFANCFDGGSNFLVINRNSKRVNC